MPRVPLLMRLAARTGVITSSSPSPRRQPRAGDVGQNRLDHMRVVVDAELVGYGQEQGVGLGDRLFLPQLLAEHLRLGGIAPAEDGSRLVVDEADLVFAFVAMPEIGAAGGRPARRCCGSP